MNLNFRQKEIADYYRKRWDIEVFLDSKAGTQSKSFGINEQKTESSNDLYDHDCFYATSDL